MLPRKQVLPRKHMLPLVLLVLCAGVTLFTAFPPFEADIHDARPWQGTIALIEETTTAIPITTPIPNWPNPQWKVLMRDVCKAASPYHRPTAAATKQDGWLTYSKFGAHRSLGNQLSQYAAMRSLAKYHGLTAKLPSGASQGHLRYFRANMPDMTEEDMNGCCDNAFVEDKALRYTTQDAARNLTKNVDIRGYFHSWKYYCGALDEVDREVQLQPRLRLDAKAKLEKIRDKFVVKGTAVPSSRMVGIHVHRDGTGEKGGTLEYLQSAMDWFEANSDRPVFVVYCRTRNADWCENNMKRPNTHFTQSDEDMDDFALLATCDDSILTSGMFGWWAAWISNGNVIGLRRWNADDYVPDERDFFPPGWMLLD